MRTGVAALLAAGAAMGLTYGAHLALAGAGQSPYRDQGPEAASAAGGPGAGRDIAAGCGAPDAAHHRDRPGGRRWRRGRHPASCWP